jgi:hypothetical protein
MPKQAIYHVIGAFDSGLSVAESLYAIYTQTFSNSVTQGYSRRGYAKGTCVSEKA